jgi:hypothetical protein
MSPEITTELKIPDLWFDFYARFLPGTLFVSAVYLLYPGHATIPSGWLIAILALAGYCIGLLVQPISSEVVGLLHGVISMAATGDWDFVRKQKHLDPLRILSKMHGETTFFVQCFVLSIMLLILQKMSSFHLESTPKTINATVLFLIFAIVMAADFAWRRVRRAKSLKKIAEVL